MTQAKLLAAAAAVLLTALTAGCASLPGAAPPPAGFTSSATFSPSGPDPAASHGAPALRQVHDPGRVTGTLAGPCRFRGQVPDELPDPRCTPGAYDPSVTAAVLCAPGYGTASYRAAEDGPDGTERFKYDVAYPAYGVPQGTRTELDHLVPLELGGANAASNLWPETPPTPNPKDRVEDRLRDWVCAVSGAAAQARLTAAQRAIAADWLTAEQVLGISS
jgi:hypothetical protein